jgi:hypothetical protein
MTFFLLISALGWAAQFPSKEEMKKRLYAVESDSKLRKEYFPLLYPYALQKKSPSEISSIFLNTIDQFSNQNKTPKMIRAQLIPRAFGYIRVLFAECPEEMKEALKILNETYLAES